MIRQYWSKFSVTSKILQLSWFISHWQDDLEKVAKSAYDQISLFGMNDRLGPVIYQKPYNPETSRIIDEVTHAKT